MAVIYLRHPIHGYKVASSDMEAAHDRANGWKDFDPEADKPVVVPAFLSGGPAAPVASDLPEDFPGREHLVAAGFTTWASVVELDREGLIAVKGIGPKTADEILKVMES